ncbi:MAG: hypothetical protein ABI895_41955 [Deltaproteobacteria bacterium]
MTRSFLGASLITLSCLALAAACGDDEGDDNGTGGSGGTSTAGSGGTGMAGSGTGGTSAAGTGGAGGTGMATAGTGGIAGSTNTGVVLDAGLDGGSGDDAGGPGGGEDAGGGGTATNEFDAAYQVLVDNCGSCHGNDALTSTDRPAFAQTNIEAAFAVADGASPRGGTIATRIIAEGVTNRDMPPACNGGALGTGQCLTQAEANILTAWVAAGADR